ncbi:hypothetical protein [Phenylobacterium sp.]|uniref:hypothetical protein n=1 Tax=Phenylobacterium sp. TaxID=1871053 RepID=UPI00356AA794
MWIFIPDLDDSKEPWVGTVTPPAQPGASWTFELIRQVEESVSYDASTLDNRPAVIGLVNYQQKCTLLRPRVLHIDPGSLGVRLPLQRTRITGEFDGLLTDLAVEDVTAETFDGFELDSSSFGVWYAPPAFTSRLDGATRTYKIEIPDTKTIKLPLQGLGTLTVMTAAQVAEKGRTAQIRSSAFLHVDFDYPASLESTIELSLELEQLFGFLIGYRGPFPKIRTWLNKTYRVGSYDLPEDGVLEMAGMDWKPGEEPHRMECIHRDGLGGATLESVLGIYLVDRPGFLIRFNAIEMCRHFTSNLNTQFSIIIPAFESYLKARYTTPDEADYTSSEAAFFAWVDTAPDEAIKDFSRKHLSVVERKAPSLQTLVGRAIAMANEKGFVFPTTLAKRIAARRGKLFHSVAGFEEGEAQLFYEEVRAVVGLLLLHTFDDLGVDVSYMGQDYNVRELRTFTARGAPKDGA